VRAANRPTAGLALALTICWALALGFSGASDALLYLAPALLIAVPLIGGRYLGESLVIKLAARGRRTRRRPTPARALPKAPAIWLPRGTRLIAFSMAERPPPPPVSLT
jgi:hypothetical protein